jgi:diacylglycerol kinase (ATP)
VIVNERANWGRCGLKLREMTHLLRRQGFPFRLAPSTAPKHAEELAAAATAGRADTIVIVGGDGTINEVVNGLFASGCSHVPRIGIIPLGSSNDFSKSLGIPQDLPEACLTVTGGTVRGVDVGRVGSHYFCTASCLGYFAEIAARSLQMRWSRGSLRYTLPALAVIKEMASGWQMNIRTDNGVFRGTYGVLLVGNTSRFGGLTMLPGARFNDGLFDCLLIEMASKWEALHLIPLVYKKALERHKRVVRFRTKSLSVSLSRPSRLCNDGEVYPTPLHQLDYAVLPQRLPVICRMRQDLATKARDIVCLSSANGTTPDTCLWSWTTSTDALLAPYLIPVCPGLR